MTVGDRCCPLMPTRMFSIVFSTRVVVLAVDPGGERLGDGRCAGVSQPGDEFAGCNRGLLLGRGESREGCEDWAGPPAEEVVEVGVSGADDDAAAVERFGREVAAVAGEQHIDSAGDHGGDVHAVVAIGVAISSIRWR